MGMLFIKDFWAFTQGNTNYILVGLVIGISITTFWILILLMPISEVSQKLRRFASLMVVVPGAVYFVSWSNPLIHNGAELAFGVMCAAETLSLMFDKQT